MPELREELEHRLKQVVGLSERDARHAVDEVIDMFRETVDEFIAARHTDLQRQGMRTDAIYREIRAELREWRFRAPELSLRQIRRRIYG